MSRSVLLLTLVVLLAPRPARAEDDDPKLRNRPLSEWLQMLREDPSPERRRAAMVAAELIGPVKSPKVVSAVIAVLRDDADEKLREAAAASLGRMSERLANRPAGEKTPFTAGRDALVGAMRTDKSVRVRTAAATSLGKLEKSDATGAVPDLGAVVGSGDSPPPVRAAAADALRRIGPEAAEAVPQLKQALADRTADEPTRTRAAQALGNIGGEPALDALPTLLATLGDAQAPVEVVRAVAETVGRLGPDAAEAAPRLGELLTAKTSDLELRRAAGAALDHFGAEARPALPALRKALQDDDRFVRSLSLHVIGQMGTTLGSEARPTVAAVLACAGDRVVEVRVAAVETVSSLGAEALGPDLAAARERLREATRDGSKAVRDAAEVALKKLGPAP
jgi:HEAT repeat protein